MKYKLFLPNLNSNRDNRGFTLVELLVANLLGLLMIGLAISVTLGNRDAFQYDLARTKLNQNLRSGIDLLGVNVREAGENLPPTVPAIELVDGSSGQPDQLVLRRNLIDEVLKLCDPISSGSTSSEVYFANSSGEPGCSYSDQTQNFNAWQAQRTSQGGTSYAYIFDPATQVGEVFEFDSEVDGGTEYYIERTSGSWQNDYNVGLTAIYIIEEWRFQQVDDPYDSSSPKDLFQVIENSQTSTPFTVVYGITDFQVEIVDTLGNTYLDFSPTDEWTDIEYVHIVLSGEEKSNRGNINRELEARFFPRNILSH